MRASLAFLIALSACGPTQGLRDPQPVARDPEQDHRGTEFAYWRSPTSAPQPVGSALRADPPRTGLTLRSRAFVLLDEVDDPALVARLERRARLIAAPDDDDRVLYAPGDPIRTDLPVALLADASSCTARGVRRAYLKARDIATTETDERAYPWREAIEVRGCEEQASWGEWFGIVGTSSASIRRVDDPLPGVDPALDIEYVIDTDLATFVVGDPGFEVLVYELREGALSPSIDLPRPAVQIVGC